MKKYIRCRLCLSGESNNLDQIVCSKSAQNFLQSGSQTLFNQKKMQHYIKKKRRTVVVVNNIAVARQTGQQSKLNVQQATVANKTQRSNEVQQRGEIKV